MAVKVRERPPGSGKWWVYTDYQGKRSARFIPQGKRTAEKIAAKITEKLGLLDANRKNGITVSLHQVVLDQPESVSQEPVQPAGPTFKQYAEAWLEQCDARGLKHTTYRSYKGILKTHLYPVFGSLPLSQIDRKMVKAFALEKRKTPAPVACRDDQKKEKPKKPASISTVRLLLCTMSAVFTSAIEDGLVQHNPAVRPGRFMRMRGKRDDINPFSQEEETVFLKKVQEHYPGYFPLFLFLLRTGCRIGEAVALQPGDIDFRSRFIEIRRNWTNGRLTTPKNGKTRRIDLSKRLAEVLKEHLTAQDVEAIGAGKPRPEWVFCNEEGKILDPDNLRHRIFYKTLEHAELRRIRLHDLRHTFCSRLIANGESLAYAKDQMGHSSIQVTVDLYGHLVPGSNKEAVDRLDEALEKAEMEAKSATIRNQNAENGYPQGGSVAKLLIYMEPASGVEPPTC